MYISSVQQMNENSIEFSLSTQTKRVIKSSQAKSLQKGYIQLLKLPQISLVHFIAKKNRKQ